MSSISQPKYYRQRIVKFAQHHSVTETAIRYKVSRKTVYKWLSRYDGHVSSLEDRSHRPKNSPHKHTEKELRQIRTRLKRHKWTDLLLAYQELVERDGYTRSYGGFKRIAAKLKSAPVVFIVESQKKAQTVQTGRISRPEDPDRCKICAVILCDRWSKILPIYGGR